MITTRDLAKLAKASGTYLDASEIEVRPPVGKYLPKEWEAKLGAYKFDEAKYYILENVHLAGPNLAGFYNDDLILDVGYYGRLDLWERNDQYFKWAKVALSIDPIKIPAAMSMSGVWSGNYFHWTIDHLPTLMALWTAERREGCKIPALVWKPAKFARETLNYLETDFIEVRAAHYLVERLLVPTWPRQDGYVNPGAADFLYSIQPHRLDVPSGNVHISRRNAESRRLDNEEDVNDLLKEYDFETVAMEDFSWNGQTRIMSRAELIVGEHGAGMINALYAPNTSRVIELVSPNYTNPCVWLAACSQEMNYGFVLGESDGGKESDNYYVNPGLLKDLIERMV